MTGHTGKGFPYALPTDALIDWPTASLELATKLEARASVVASLPTSPADGDEVYYVHPAGTAVWHLRYRAAAGSYKWECIGGTPLYAVQTSVVQNGATGTWTNLLPSLISLPLAGQYEATAAGQIAAGASACTVNTTLYQGTVAVPIGVQSAATLPAAGYAQAFALPAQNVQVAGSVNIGLAGMGNVVNCTFTNLGVRVMPLRLT